MGPGEESQVLQGFRPGLGVELGLGALVASYPSRRPDAGLFPAAFSLLTDAFLPFQVLPPQELS